MRTKYKKKNFIICFTSWTIVIIWLILIFIMSSMNNYDSNEKSKKVVSGVMNKTVETTNKLGITNNNLSENKKKQIIEKLNYPTRKIAHASEYFILSLLFINALICSGINNKKTLILFSVILCFMYSCTDEYHQTFITGRTGQFVDCLIDTFGEMLGCLMYCFLIEINKIRKKHI